MTTIIHINAQRIRSNLKNGTNVPPIMVLRGRQKTYGHRVRIDGPVQIVYSPAKALTTGARVWIETEAVVEIMTETP